MKATELLRRCWCGEASHPTSVTANTFRLLRCGDCGTYAIDPPPIVSDEQSADFYTAYYSLRGAGPTSSTEPGRFSRYWRVVRQVPDLERHGRMVIDFGSGDGRLCYELADAGWRDVVGLDVSRARVAKARTLYPGIRFFDGRLEDTELMPGQADLCVMDNVIEHLTDPVAVLERLRPYLGEGGRFVVITPNMESGHFKLLGRRWTPELAPHAHVFLFTPSSLARALEQAGLAVQHVGSFHDDRYPLTRWGSRLLSGDVKGALWRAHQEMGWLYGRLIGAGSMVYAVGEVRRAADTRPALAEAAS